ncbi:MAG: type II toxin-antitoxin system Phd/YefM family antitoxin [Nitratireductor rhodophyticola]|uniref:type II toxin-antitoxin system Phd/YefM family antitoxin n=1 Tax=Nitratireductor rhodophyticola TaxID=2854036 RepID=UPI0032D92F93
MTMVIVYGHFGFYICLEGRRSIKMTVQVSKSRFKARALEYFRKVEKTGEPLIVTDHGKPTLEIRPLERKADVQAALKRLKGSVTSYQRPFDPVDDADWDVLG